MEGIRKVRNHFRVRHGKDDESGTLKHSVNSEDNPRFEDTSREEEDLSEADDCSQTLQITPAEAGSFGSSISLAKSQVTNANTTAISDKTHHEPPPAGRTLLQNDVRTQGTNPARKT